MSRDESVRRLSAEQIGCINAVAADAMRQLACGDGRRFDGASARGIRRDRRPRVHQELRAVGWPTSTKRVARLLREAGLAA